MHMERSVLELSARRDQQSSVWIQELMTPMGWAHYQELGNQVNESAAIITGQAPAIARIQPAQLFSSEVPTRGTGGASWFSFIFVVRRSFWTISPTSAGVVLLPFYHLGMG